MGFRFRKSINLGGGVRINFSKSGIGYSFGVLGLRYTHPMAEYEKLILFRERVCLMLMKATLNLKLNL